MERRMLIVLRWVLYALGAVLALVLQQSVFARLPVLGAAACLMPVAAALVAMREGPEAGGLFGLGLGLLWCLSGVRYGPMYIALLALAGVLVGGLCRDYFRCGVLPALVLALVALAVCEVPVLLLLLYLGKAGFGVFAMELLISLIFVFPGYPLVWAISRIGGV